MSNWKISTFGSKTVIQNALQAYEEVDCWDPQIVISGREKSGADPDEWVLEAWYSNEPTSTQKFDLTALFGKSKPTFSIKKLPDEDWVTLSQKGIKPIRAGRFYVHSPNHTAESGLTNFVIPAGLAFGTGHHETTAGCMLMLDRMKNTGIAPRNIIDIGTGTGLLAFAANSLWPSAKVTASDIDEVCAEVVQSNAAKNNIKMGSRNGQISMVIANGLQNELLMIRAPYDLLIANILAGPLLELASDFGQAISPGGSLLITGILESQESQIRKVYQKNGFRLAMRFISGDWPILWFRKRRFSLT